MSKAKRPYELMESRRSIENAIDTSRIRLNLWLMALILAFTTTRDAPADAQLRFNHEEHEKYEDHAEKDIP